MVIAWRSFGVCGHYDMVGPFVDRRNAMDYRVTELFTEEGWQDIEFADLVEGDIFRMFEDNYKQNPVISEDGCDIFIATSNPFIGDNQVYEIECVSFEDIDDGK